MRDLKKLLILLFTIIFAILYFFGGGWNLNSNEKKGSNHVILKEQIVKAAILTKDGLDIETLDQKDPALVEYVRNNVLTPPSTQPYNFPNDTNFGELLLLSVLPPLFKKKPGFFLEAGAYDGRTASFTLSLEVSYGWTGLLVECNPNLVPKVRSLHRKAYFSNACLSKSTYPKRSEMTSVDDWMASSSLGDGPDLFPDFTKLRSKHEVLTIPLYTLLAAAGVTTVDFAILDVQSLEWDVLRNFPFDLIFVKIWVVEFDLLSEGDRKEVQKLMIAKGYNDTVKFSADYFFIHSSLLPIA